MVVRGYPDRDNCQKVFAQARKKVAIASDHHSGLRLTTLKSDGLLPKIFQVIRGDPQQTADRHPTTLRACAQSSAVSFFGAR